MSVWLGSIPCAADFLAELSRPLMPAEYEKPLDTGLKSYLAPNEGTPVFQAPLLRKAPAGVHVSVGTERGFIGAAFNPAATHVLLVDMTPTVTQFNQINVALLKLADGDLTAYRQLRLKASAAEWQKRATELLAAGRLDRSSAELLSSKAVWENWKFGVRENQGFAGMHVRPGKEDFFYGANYLHDKKLFARLSALAREDRIQAVTMNLTDETQLRQLVSAMKTAKLPLSALDVSNAWWPQYMPAEQGGFARMLGAFEEVSQPKSLLMMSSWNMQQPIPTMDGGPDRIWGYFGFTFDKLSPAKERGAALQTYLWANNNHPLTEEQWGSDLTTLRYAGTLNDRKATKAMDGAAKSASAKPVVRGAATVPPGASSLVDCATDFGRLAR
ncbi:MAG: hypothetical protein NDJ90_03605 [Oligoflexia bacterium]|nr:hypothetical protein [Oligoflexia bacterium]